MNLRVSPPTGSGSVGTNLKAVHSRTDDKAALGCGVMMRLVALVSDWTSLSAGYPFAAPGYMLPMSYHLTPC